jgi:glycosyltransferase involved in cell wall biosynthesis
VTWSDRRAGGVESYLDACLPELAGLGHTLSLWFETSEPEGRARLAAALSLPSFRLRDAPGGPVRALREWRPDVVLSNGLSDCSLERQLHAVAPAVFVAHNYHGTCISGTKCWSAPVRRPCSRTFGTACLALYYPRRCGGLNPATMMRMYAKAQRRLESVKACRRLVVLSSHMHDEYRRHGVDPARIAIVPFGPAAPAAAATTATSRSAEVHLAFLGRLEHLKGPDLLVDALETVRGRLGRPVTLTVIGDGSDRASLERRASAVRAAEPAIRVTFTGWLSPVERDEHLRRADALVVPSVWPEPFGLVGLDAALLGVPAVAFDVGGVRDWLIDGVTGRLAAADPPSSDTLAAAIVDVVGDAARLSSYRAECRRHALTRSPALHARGLVDVLAAAVHDDPLPAGG